MGDRLGPTGRTGTERIGVNVGVKPAAWLPNPLALMLFPCFDSPLTDCVLEHIARRLYALDPHLDRDVLFGEGSTLGVVVLLPLRCAGKNHLGVCPSVASLDVQMLFLHLRDIRSPAVIGEDVPHSGTRYFAAPLPKFCDEAGRTYVMVSEAVRFVPLPESMGPLRSVKVT